MMYYDKCISFLFLFACACNRSLLHFRVVGLNAYGSVAQVGHAHHRGKDWFKASDDGWMAGFNGSLVSLVVTDGY